MLYSLTLQEKIESSTDVLEEILKPVVEKVEGEEIPWPPRAPEALKQMEEVKFYFNYLFNYFF